MAILNLIRSASSNKIIDCGNQQFNLPGQSYNGSVTKDIDLKQIYNGYKSLDTSNFILEFVKTNVNYTAGNNANISFHTPVLTYNKDTGILRVSIGYNTGLHGTAGAYILLNLYISRNSKSRYSNPLLKVINSALLGMCRERERERES